jgi:hypothetical protein
VELQDGNGTPELLPRGQCELAQQEVLHRIELVECERSERLPGEISAVLAPALVRETLEDP